MEEKININSTNPQNIFLTIEEKEKFDIAKGLSLVTQKNNIDKIIKNNAGFLNSLMYIAKKENIPVNINSTPLTSKIILGYWLNNETPKNLSILL